MVAAREVVWLLHGGGGVRRSVAGDHRPSIAEVA